MLSILNFQRTRKNDVITRFHTIVGIGDAHYANSGVRTHCEIPGDLVGMHQRKRP
jgi:hypothetical protein